MGVDTYLVVMVSFTVFELLLGIFDHERLRSEATCELRHRRSSITGRPCTIQGWTLSVHDLEAGVLNALQVGNNGSAGVSTTCYGQTPSLGPAHAAKNVLDPVFSDGSCSAALAINACAAGGGQEREE